MNSIVPPMLIPGLLALCLGWATPCAAASTSGDELAIPARPRPAVGKSFGQLVLPTLDGSRSVSLDVYRGRKVLLIEFASW